MSRVETYKSNITLKVSRDFTDTPGPRRRDEGDFSGEEFLEKKLKPKYLEAFEKKVKLIIDLDDVEGYGTSFLESAFGGLARIYEPKEVLNTLEIVSKDEPLLKQEIENYIKSARD